MCKQLVICASAQAKKYYFEPSFNDMPAEIKQELTDEAVAIAQKVNGIIAIGFNGDGNIYIEEQQEYVFVDNIGVELEIRRFQQQKKDFLKSLKIWYLMYRTEYGSLVRDILLKQSEGMDDEEIISEIYNQLGQQSANVAEMLLE
ncbi:MAG: hypothetical protein BEN18_06510 [Epulopiscium sp. Nuni2H_MBin001]|nr:MAG: hypothetical protein BEN18_06510 [Epulopiscium sp. Nuni2H_MBin001]